MSLVWILYIDHPLVCEQTDCCFHIIHWKILLYLSRRNNSLPGSSLLSNLITVQHNMRGHIRSTKAYSSLFGFSITIPQQQTNLWLGVDVRTVPTCVSDRGLDWFRAGAYGCAVKKTDAFPHNLVNFIDFYIKKCTLWLNSKRQKKN